jgi:hypothetical protein
VVKHLLVICDPTQAKSPLDICEPSSRPRRPKWRELYVTLKRMLRFVLGQRDQSWINLRHVVF